MREAHKGRVISIEQRRKISESRLARKAKLGYLNSPATRRKLSEGRRGTNNWNYGHPASELLKQRTAEANHRRVGWHHTPETRARMGQSRRGSRNPAWKGGITTPEQLKFLHRRYRVRKRANGGSHTLEQWQALKALYNHTCPGCSRREPQIKLTADHIIPISEGGSDNIENIQPLCQSCNSTKYRKTIKFPLPAERNI